MEKVPQKKEKYPVSLLVLQKYLLVTPENPPEKY